MGDGLKRARAAARASRLEVRGRSAFLVECADGEITGKFENPLSIVEEQAMGMNVNCECGGPHRVIRMEQQGTGRLVSPNS